MHSKTRALDKIYKRRDRYEIPEWQRDEVWPEERKQLLIDSVLCGWKLPKFYLARTSESVEEFEVVDGQQRLTAIFEFFDGSLSLSAASARRFGGSKYADLPDDVVDSLDDYEVEYDEILEATEAELKEFFRRLQGGLALTGSEKLNAVHSNLTDYARKLAKHTFFTQKVAIRDTRKAHLDIVTKVAAIEVDGIETGLRYEDLHATFVANANFSPDSSTGKRLRRVFDFLDRVFAARNSVLRNRSTVQSIATLSATIVARTDDCHCEAQFGRFLEHFGKELSRQVELGQEATDDDYLAFQRTLSANVKAGAATRHEILLRKLLLFDPSFTDVFGPDALVVSGIHTEVSRVAARVAALVEAINDRYAAKHGKDLFKATNKTVAALRRAGSPVSDLESYRTLIDDLYFVFRESVGQRIAEREPASFADVNDLRTALRHDVDHGKPRAIAAKKRKLAKTFAKYGGTASPAAVAPHLFPLIQSSILAALEVDLQQLLKDPE